MNLLGMRRAAKALSTTYQYVSAAKHSPLSLSEQKQLWAQDILRLANVEYECLGTPSSQQPLILVGNHISYIDIPLLIAHMPQAAFVAKKEISQWPIVGAGARVMETIFVARGDAQHRSQAKNTIKSALTQDKRVMAVFPAGTTTLNEHKPWRFGAFEAAQATNTPVQAFRIRYSPLRLMAYIDRDFFPWHLAKVCSYPRIKAVIEFKELCHVQDFKSACAELQEWAREKSSPTEVH